MDFENEELCENDNWGVRYFIIGLYVLLEKFEKAKKNIEN